MISDHRHPCRSSPHSHLTGPAPAAEAIPAAASGISPEPGQVGCTPLDAKHVQEPGRGTRNVPLTCAFGVSSPPRQLLMTFPQVTDLRGRRQRA